MWSLAAKGYTLYNTSILRCTEPVENPASPVPIPHMEYPMPPCDYSLAASLKGTVTLQEPRCVDKLSDSDFYINHF